VQDGLRRGDAVLLGERQGWHLHDGLAVDPQRFAAGAQDLQVGTRPQQAVGEDRGGVGQVFAVVEDEQHPLGRQELGQRAHDPARRCIAQPQGAGNRFGQEGGIVQLGQLGQADAIGEGPSDVRRRTKGEPSLSHSGRADQREEGRGGHRVADLTKLAAPSYEAGQIPRQTLGCRRIGRCHTHSGA
jgi:hypothetical protein